MCASTCVFGGPDEEHQQAGTPAQSEGQGRQNQGEEALCIEVIYGLAAAHLGVEQGGVECCQSVHQFGLFQSFCEAVDEAQRGETRVGACAVQGHSILFHSKEIL